MGFDEAEVEQIRRVAQAPVSLERPVGEGEDSELGDLLEDESTRRPDEAVEIMLRAEALAQALSMLSERERRVLELRFGLNGERPRTLDEVGRTFDVTRERIRQIESGCLRKLAALADGSLRDVA